MGKSPKRQKAAKQGRPLANWVSNAPDPRPANLRIIGGEHRGRQIRYSGDPLTRPMKDNVREALFNLVGGWIEDKLVFDLFAGTGAVGLEALSRGASAAVFIERHFPTAKLVSENLASLELTPRGHLFTADSFFWARQFFKAGDAGFLPGPQLSEELAELCQSCPWVVFCCPPYRLFADHQPQLISMLEGFLNLAPADSILVVESDESFDPAKLPRQSDGSTRPEPSECGTQPDESESPNAIPHWRVRQYPPAQIAIWR